MQTHTSSSTIEILIASCRPGGRALLVATALTALVSQAAVATPRYSVRYGQSCHLCHVNPTGGGQRSLFGAQFFSYTDLAMKTLSFDELDRVDPELTDQVQIGFDLRTLYTGADEPGTNTFLAMQGDVYLSVQLSETWFAQFDEGLRDDYEVMATGHVLPANGYVKAGRFVPPYGMRIADHTAFVRERLGFDYAWKETGLEIGFHPEPIDVAVAVTNGNTLLLDGDEMKAVTARGDVRTSALGANLWIGVTGRWNGHPDLPDDRIAGGYGGLAAGPVTVLGEVAFRRFRTDALVTFVELAALVSRGVTIRAEYDFHDRDVDETSGADNMWVLGAEIVPRGYLQLIGNVRLRRPTDDAVPDVAEGDLQLHLFF